MERLHVNRALLQSIATEANKIDSGEKPGVSLGYLESLLKRIRFFLNNVSINKDQKVPL